MKVSPVKKLDIFNDEEFQSLDLGKKRAIVGNYFDQELADEEFKGLDAQKQEAIRSSFTDAQLDFSIKDTASKAIDYLMPPDNGIVKTEKGTPPDMSWNVPAPLPAEMQPTVAGNLDTAKPIAMVKNPDGSISTVRTMSFNDGKHEVLIPTVHPDGYIMSDKDAIDYYRQTGKNFGKFETPEAATDYAQWLHEGQAKLIPPADAKAQDEGMLAGIKSVLFGTGEAYTNPEAGDYELGKRLVNRTNELTSNAIQAVYAFLGDVKTPAEYLGITTDANEALNAQRKEWFKKASSDLNDFVYEKNKLDVKPTHTWAETKKAFKAGGVFNVDSWQELLSYGGSELVASAPDMAEMVSVLPLYYASRLQESAEKRAANDGRKAPSTKDYLAVAPTTAGSIMLDLRGLHATTTDVVERVGKEALDGSLKSVTGTIAREMKNGFLVEGTTEALQNPLEQFGEEVNTKKGLSTLGEYADVTLAGFAAGGVMGAGMSGATSTGTEVFNAYTKEAQDAQREAFIRDAYLRQSLGEGRTITTDDTAFDTFKANLDGKIRSVQEQFENLVINHPDVKVPVEAVDNVAIQEAVVAQAKADGLDVSDGGGLNAIDKGFKELAAEMDVELPGIAVTPNPVNPPIETLQPQGLDLEVPAEPAPEPTPIIEKPVIGQPEPEASAAAGETVPAMGAAATAPEPFTDDDAARLAELEQIPDDDLNIDDRFELEDLREKRDATKPQAEEKTQTQDPAQTKPDVQATDTNRDYVVKNYTSLTPEQKTKYQDTLDALYQERMYEVANALGVKVAEVERKFEHTGAGANVTGASYYGVKDELQDIGALVEAIKAARTNTERSMEAAAGTKTKRKKLTGNAAAVKAASDVPIGGSEDATAEAVKQARKGVLDPDRNIKNMTREQQEQQEALALADKYTPQEMSRAYDYLQTESKTVKGVQGSIPGMEPSGQNALFDTEARTEYVVPKWAKGIVSNTTRYDDIIKAVTDAKNGIHSTLSGRVMDALHQAGDPHLENEIKRFDELNERWDLNELEQQELEALAVIMQNHLKGEEDGTTGKRETATEEAAAPAAAGDHETVQAAEGTGAQQGRSERTGDQRVSDRGAAARLTFDTEKVYSTKGIYADYPNREVGKKIQKDVARYVGQLAKALGYEFDTGKGGKKLPWNGVSANLAPAGGDMSFRLFKPGSDVGVYVTLSYQPDMTPGGSYDGYRLRGMFNDRQMWRTTIRGKGSRFDGGNQWAKKEELTEPSFIDAIIKQVDTQERINEQASGTQTDSGPAVPKTPVRPGDGEPAGVQPAAVRGTGSESAGDGAAQVPDTAGQRRPGDGGAAGKSRVSAPRSQERGGENAHPAVRVTDETTEAVTEIDRKADEAREDRRADQEKDRVPGDNFEIEDELGEGGQKTKFRNNVEAIKIVHKIQDYNYSPTLEEKKILSRYVGWGGLPNAFVRPDGSVAKGWEKEADELKGLLSDAQYEEARRSTQDAFYTSKEVVNAMWAGVKRLGFKGGKVLEPSVGVGNFFGLMPSSLKPSTKLYGVELDGITSTIAAALYPKATITNAGLQDVKLGNDYALAIGNPPFGSQKLFDKNAKHLKDFNIHNYFFAKSMDALEPGGVLVMVVSNGLMDAGNTKAREYLGSKANLLGAIRLPNNAFSKNAGTEVTTDIIFLQKRYDGQESNIEEWRDVGELNDTPINQYYADHPDMLLGTWGKFGSMYRADAPALISFEGGNTAELLKEAIAKLPQNVVTHEAASGEETAAPVFDGDVSKVRVGALFVQDGTIYKRYPDADGEPQVEAMETKLNSKDEEVAYAPKELERIKGMIDVVGVADTLRQLQLDSSATEAQLKKGRADLNRAYDAFVKQFGFVNNPTNARLFEEDIRAPFLLALEKNYDKGVSKAVAKKTGQLPRSESAQKADIFTQRTQTPYVRPTKADSAKDALTIALGEYGGVNLPYMAELTGKAEDELISELDGFIYEDPNDGWVTKEEYLSGNVKRKLAETDNPTYKAALKEVIPEDIAAVDISVTLGASWIPKQDMADFVTYITGDENPTVTLAAFNGKWSVQARVSSANASRWGTERRGADMILQQTMNLAVMEVKDNHGTSAQPVWVLNTDATTAVQEKQEQLKAEFKEWIWKSAERRERLGRLYNDTFNTSALRQYDGSHLTFPGKSETIDLRQHQKNAAWRTIQGGTVLFDHTVGTGKTFTNIAAIMEKRRIGKARKPLVVVPNHLTGQWGKEWMELYPSASILVPTKKDFTAKRRKTLMSRIATGDYDAIIIAHSQLSKIQNDPEFETLFIKDEIKRIQQGIDELREAEGKDARSVKNAEKSKESLEARLEKLNDLERDENLNFTELGIDDLSVDEAHEFKNLAYTTGLQRVAGLGNPAGSKKAFDLFIKSQHLLKKTGGNNLTFLTGTPISNTIAEMFTMQRYLSYDKLKEQNLDVFDAWVKQYAEIVSDWELTASGKYKLNTRLSKFNNMPELITEYKQFADVVTRDDIPALPIPRVSGGKPQNIVVERSAEQADYIGVEDKNGRYPEHSLVYRSEHLPKGKPEKGADNMLKIMGEARKVALDMRLIDPGAADNPDSKVNVAVENAVEIYRKWNAKKGTQLMFCDLSTPKGAVAKEKARIAALIKKADAGDEKAAEEMEKMNPDDLDALNSEFSVYDDIKSKLIARGIPEREIAFIHDANTELQKQELFGKVKAGTVRILLGSTSKMGAGMNVQNRLVALHHLDVPWRPSDLEQREGRIIRQGNEFYAADPKGFEVGIFRYATKNTLDSMMWQTIEAKANFIEQLRAGSLVEREVEDVSGEAMSAAEMKALSSGNPLILEDMKLTKDIKKLEALKKSHDRNQYDLEAKIKRARSLIDESASKQAVYDADAERAKALGKGFAMTINGVTFDKREDAGTELVHLAKNAPKGKNVPVGSVAGFDLSVENIGKDKLFGDSSGMVIVSGKQDYEIMFDIEHQSYEGLAQKVVNQIKRIAAEAQDYAQRVEETKRDLPQLEEQVGEFKSAAELDALKLRKKEVLAQLRKKDEEHDTPKEAEREREMAESMMKLPAEEAKAKLTKRARGEQRETEHYARLRSYDEAGANYIPPYRFGGLPARPTDGTITIGSREVVLPTLDAPINADSLRVYVSDIVGNRLYEGKLRGKSNLGKYRRSDSAIRTKSYSDVEVMAHELAHYLDFFHNNKTRDAKGSYFRKEILKHSDEVEALSYTTKPKEVLSEGFAEFVRLWLTNYNALEMVAPGMINAFESRLKQDKALNEKMQRLQEGMHQYYFQGEHAMLRSKRGGELNPTAKKLKRSQAEIGKELRQQAIDKIHSIKRIEAAVRGDIAPDAIDSPYKLLQMVNGHSAVMYSAMNIGVPTVTETGDITYGGKPLNEIFAPATKVGEDRVRLLEDYMVAKRAGELMEQGRENLITKEEIAAGLKLAEVYPEFETIFEEYQLFNDAMLDFYVDMNLITSSQRENFQEFNRNYVPFNRIIESVQYGEVSPGSIGRRLTGGTHSLGNIMENIINGLDTNIKEAMISRGKSVFYDMLEKSGMGGVYATKVGRESRLVKTDVEQQAKKIAQIMAELGIAVSKDGMIMSGDMTAGEVYDVKEIEENLLAHPETLEFWTHGHKPASTTAYIDSAIIDDKQVYFEVNDPGIVDAITSFRAAHYNEFVQGLMTIKNIMTWNITNNPLFYLTNFMRDTVSASVLSKNKFAPVISSVAGMYHFITKSKTYKEFMAAGGGYGTRRTTLGKEVDAMRMLDVNRGLEVVGRVASAMEYGADIFEYGTRVGDFALAKKAGKSNLQAAYEGREVSTDFAIKGSNQAFTGFMATVPFMKAAINGLDKTSRRIFALNGEMKLSNAVKFRSQLGELQTHKIKIYATGGILAGLSLALWLQNRDDERYKKLTRDQKMLYWNFFVGDQHIKIPKPYDIGFVFASLPELFSDGIYAKHGKDAAEDFLWGLKTMFSVGDVSGLFQPILEQMTNTNWMGSPIVPYHMQNIDDLGDQYFSNTPLMYRKLGEATGASPILTQHYVDGYLGLTAKMIEEITENMLWNKKEWGARPFAQDPLEFLTYRFRGREVDPRTKYSEKYYELMARASAVKASFDQKRKEAFADKGEKVKEYMSQKEKQAYVQVDKMMRKYSKILTNIKLMVETVSYDKALTKAQKEQKINDAYAARTDLFKTVTENLENELKKLEGK
jgi:N12 class adenine-specific DNA methylase